MEKAAATVVGALLAAQLSVAEEVDFRFSRERFVVVPVIVNGHGPYDFLLDTGSTTSVVDKELADELDLKPLQQTVIRTASGTEHVPIARVHAMRIGSRSIETVLVLISGMTGVRSLDGKIRGILGFNLLSRLRYTLDYRCRTLRLDEQPLTGARIPFDARGRSIVLAPRGFRWLLDTGATGVFVFGTAGVDVAVSARGVTAVSTNAGRRITKSGVLYRLDIGEVSLRRVPVTIVPETGLESSADGLLPGALFASIHFDHENAFVVLSQEDTH